MGNGWHSFFLKARGGREGRERERERRTHTDTHTHPIVRAEAESRQGREGERGEREPQSSPAPLSWDLPGQSQHVGPQPACPGILPAAFLLLCFVSDCVR